MWQLARVCGWKPELKEWHTMEASQAYHGCRSALLRRKEKAQTFCRTDHSWSTGGRPALTVKMVILLHFWPLMKVWLDAGWVIWVIPIISITFLLKKKKNVLYVIFLIKGSSSVLWTNNNFEQNCNNTRYKSALPWHNRIILEKRKTGICYVEHSACVSLFQWSPHNSVIAAYATTAVVF